MRLTVLRRRLSAPGAILAAVVLVWLLYKAMFAAYWLVGLAVLLGVTYVITRRELRTLLGARNDHRPWLVRLREHRWRPIAVPFLGRAPRFIVYLLLFLAWWWWLG